MKDTDNKSFELSAREIDIVKLIEKGLSDKEIARQLNVDLSSVKNHVHQILDKFRVNRRIMAAAKYRTLSDRET